MGICVSWNLSQEISATAWDKIAHDFRKVAASFPAWIDERRQRECAPAPSFAHKISSLLGLRRDRYPRSGVPPFVWGNSGEGFSLESVEVCPSPDDAADHDTGPWSFSRRAVAGFARTNGAVHGDLLLCLLTVVQDHAPGVLTISQNDYAPGNGEPASVTIVIEAFVSGVLGRSVRLPPQEGRPPIPGPVSPLASVPLFDGPLSIDQGGVLPPAHAGLVDRDMASAAASVRPRGP